MKQRGFTVLELLVVLAVIGIIASITIPGLLVAADRGRQKRTMSDIRSLASAVETYSIDAGRYPIVADGSTAALAAALQPTYIRTVPAADAWGNPLLWIGDTNGARYTIWSAGRLGDAPLTSEGATQSINAAIVFTEGFFVQWPEGPQA